METFTIQDMLINSTDLNQILCNFGIKNISDCDDEEESAVEPKGKVNSSTFAPKIDAFQPSRIGPMLWLKVRLDHISNAKKRPQTFFLPRADPLRAFVFASARVTQMVQVLRTRAAANQLRRICCLLLAQVFCLNPGESQRCVRA